MSDVKVGMVLRSTISEFDAKYYPITVTEITDNGFKYVHEKRLLSPRIGHTSGGEHFGADGECLYEEIT